MDYSLPRSSVHGDSPGKNTEVGCCALLQGNFPTQGLNPGLPHCREILYCLSHQRSSCGIIGGERKDSPIQFSSVQLLSCVWLFATPRTAACQASLSTTNSQSLPKFRSIEFVMPSNNLILCCPLLLLPSIFPSTGVFSNKSVLCIRWPKYWSFSFCISPSNEHAGLISFRIDWFDLRINFLFPFMRFMWMSHFQGSGASSF